MQVSIASSQGNDIVNVPVPGGQSNPKQPRFERFGGSVPFQHHTASPDNYFGNDVDNSDQSNNVYYV
jgi:hypothetical protein